MTQTQEKKQRKPLRGLLVASLAVNLAVAGVVGGAFLSHKRFDGDGPKASERFGTPYVQALSREDRRKVGRAIRNSYREEGIGVIGNKALYAQTLEMLRAPTFDPQALSAVLAEIDTAAEGRRTLARDQLVARIESMSPQERAIYADRLDEMLRRGPQKRPSKPKKP
ncbi:hypothetical protein shim_17980 [Shimia sp. SK013]|uniref:periplasmic heavy metal sensor n=1 Tax=Shimia sp. SK013 TaxID=1389006 RepID=UPI0006B64D79|nr:periplasmic heavy metal sensor [Shimia sp. SK013]KPA21913.1 hypothetical protein shim_17980 [Shimia sp. SK013]